MAKKQFTDEEINLLGAGFLNAISGIYHKLKTEDEKAMFSKMVADTVGEENLQDGINEKTIDSSCPSGCHFERGVGCVC